MKKNIVIILSLVVIVLLGFYFVSAVIIKKGNSSKEGLKNDEDPQALLYKKAQALKTENSYLEALSIYEGIVEESQDSKLTEDAKRDIMALKIALLFSPTATDDSVVYIIKKGDTLGKIAKEYNTTVELLMRSNNLPSDLIRVGGRLKITTATYSVVVDRSQNVLILKSNEEVLKTYRVATGINNSTPLGEFKIVNKLKDPVWYKAGAVVPSGSPENILGSRWMGISVSGYGIHGTTQPESIGEHVTAGCVRMREPDVQELYTILPVSAEVTIID